MYFLSYSSLSPSQWVWEAFQPWQCAIEMRGRHWSQQEGRGYLLLDTVPNFGRRDSMGWYIASYRAGLENCINKRSGCFVWLRVAPSQGILLVRRMVKTRCLGNGNKKVAPVYNISSYVPLLLFSLGSVIQRKEYLLMFKGKPSITRREHVQRLEKVGFQWVA